jgi:hypothetical protein
MLRRFIIGGIVLALAACTNQAPTATTVPQPDGLTVTPPAPATLVIVTREAPELRPGELEIPLPGTLVFSLTEDPNADVPFTRIEVVRQHMGVTDRLIITGDGTFTYNGVPGVLSPQQIFNLNQAIKDINFYGLQGTMMSTVPQPDSYEYAVIIERGDDARSLVSQDKFMPNEYIQFVSTLWNTRDLLSVLPTSEPPATRAFE